MKRMAIQTLLVMCMIIIALGVSGCMNKKQDPEVIKDEMMAYLEKKYGEEFVPLSLSFSDFAYSYDRLYAYPKKGTEKDAFEVWGTRKDDGSYSMSDGYFAKYIRPEYETVMSGFVSEIYKDFKLYTDFNEGIMPDRLNKNTKIEEIYNKDELFFSDTVIFVKESSAKGIDDEESLRTIAEKMQAKKMVGSVRIYIVFDDKYESIGLETLKGLSPTEDKNYFPYYRKRIKVTHKLEIKKYGEEAYSNG
ncbi:hypothetical protein [Paenibacillus caui]|uniref:hypothetical protein n=1 Tax=Paenibacillus caui TaxID=2873927 RepID=UPI001CAA2FB9|nr:hypothetical protein [Paenibacillus caui]